MGLFSSQPPASSSLFKETVHACHQCSLFFHLTPPLPSSHPCYQKKHSTSTHVDVNEHLHGYLYRAICFYAASTSRSSQWCRSVHTYSRIWTLRERLWTMRCSRSMGTWTVMRVLMRTHSCFNALNAKRRVCRNARNMYSIHSCLMPCASSTSNGWVLH